MNGPRANGSPLGPEDLEAATAALSAQRDRLRTEVAGARDTESTLRADCDLDAADTSAKAVTIQELRVQAAEALLHRTLAALARIRDQTFGLCTACGAPIGRERVMALPHAELCVACTEQRETGTGAP